MRNFCLEINFFLTNCLKKLKSFKNLPEKIKISWENRNFLKVSRRISIFFNCLKKSKFLGNLPEKIEILLTRVHDPQISNHIDAAGLRFHSVTPPFYLEHTATFFYPRTTLNLSTDHSVIIFTRYFYRSNYFYY